MIISFLKLLFLPIYLGKISFFDFGAISGPLLGSLASGIGSGVASSGSSFLGGLFGGGKSKNQKRKDMIDAMNEQRDIAGNANSTPTSSPSPERMIREASENAGAFGKEMMGKITEQFADRGISKMLDRMFEDKYDPIEAGMNQRAFHTTAFPGTNPWEMAGSSGASGSQAVAQTQRKSAASVANKTSNASRDVAETTTEPQLKKVEFESPANVKEKTASANLKNAQASKTETEGQMAKVSAHWQPKMKQLEFSQRGLENARTSAQRDVALKQANLIRQQTLSEIQKSGKMKADKEISETYAKILKPIKDIEGISDLMLVIGTLSAAGLGSNIRALTRSKSRLKSKGVTSSPNSSNFPEGGWNAWKSRIRKQHRNSSRP